MEKTNETIDLEEMRTAIEAELAELQALSESSSDARAPVELDQQTQGRLSRQDALQSQAMAKATAQRRIHRCHALRAALQRLEDGEYGECLECGEIIQPGRLRIDPAATLCVSCAGSNRR
jgi:DnaK suppressor protein